MKVSRATWKLKHYLVAVGVFLGLLAALVYGLSDSPGQTFMVMGSLVSVVAGVVLVFFGPVLVHELGHFLAGKALGYNFYGMRLANLELSNLSTGLRFRLISKMGGAAGAVLMAPSSLDRVLVRHRLFIFAGPAASGVLAYLSYLLLIRSGGVFGAYPESGPMALNMAYQWVTIISGVFAIASLLLVFPIKGNHASDGRQLYLSFRKPAQYKLDLALRIVGCAWTYGARAGSWNTEAIDYLLENAQDPVMAARAHLIAYYQALDLGDLKRADSYISNAARIVDSVPEPDPVLFREVCLEAAYSAAYLSKDAVAAREFLVKSGATEADVYSTRDRVEGAILFAEGNEIEARRAVERAEIKLLAMFSKPLQANIVLELDLIRRVIENPQPLTSTTTTVG